MSHPFYRFRLLGVVGRWLAFFGRFLRFAGPYWRSEDRWRVRGMTGLLLALTGLQIVIATSINLWIESLFDSLEERDMDRFLILVGAAALIVVANIAVTISHLTVKRWLQIGWREWLTRRLVGEWMTDGRHYKVTLFPGEHTNPDGRIAEDIRFATENALELGHSLLYAILIFVSFATILWGLSGAPRLSIAQHSFSFPGHLVWVAVLYAAVGTFVALRLGLPLIKAQNLRQTTEADFRFGLAYARQNSLLVALLRGDDSEERSLGGLFRGAVRSWNLQTRALVSLFYFSSAWWVLSQVFPILMASPRYLAGAITLGMLMQTAQAFQQVVGAMSWPVDNISKVADWRASVERMLGLHGAIKAVERGEIPVSVGVIGIAPGQEPKLVFDGLQPSEADGRPVMKPLAAAIGPGQRVRIAVDSAAGFKLFKAMAGLWPWGRGRIVLPSDGPLFLLARRPFLPLGSLAATLTYPEPPEKFTAAALAGAMTGAGLGHLIGDLGRPGQWEEILSDDEQHRLSFARILLFRPHWVVFLETFDDLAPETRADMLRLLAQECPETALVIIGQAPGLDAFVTRRIEV